MVEEKQWLKGSILTYTGETIDLLNLNFLGGNRKESETLDDLDGLEEVELLANA